MKKKIVVQYRRKREGKTDYRLRLKLLLSKKPRLVIRKTNKGIIVQVVEYDENGDKVISATHSKELIKYGWKRATGNIPAAYFTGMLTARKVIKKGLKECIVDFGLQKVIKGSRLFAAVKGAKDGGIQLKIGEGVLPSDNRIMGEHINMAPDEFESFKKKIISI